SAPFQRMILAIYTQQKQKEGCEKTQSSFFTSPSFRLSRFRQRVCDIPVERKIISTAAFSSLK
ncbi:MAG: hypothetical protein KHY79_07830, partial [Clostridiales bacterium]|nr:hypothetical protein [Clostridiales bacterium]